MALPDVEMLLRASASARLRLRQTERRWVLGPNRTWLLLVTAAIVPLLLFGGWAGALSAEHMRSNTRALVRAKVDLVAERISTELAAQLNLGEALASSTALDTGDLAAFRLEVQRFQAMHPLWQTVQLSGPDGIALLSLLQHGTEAPSTPPQIRDFRAPCTPANRLSAGLGQTKRHRRSAWSRCRSP